MLAAAIDLLAKFKNRYRKLLLIMADLFLISAIYPVVWLMLNGRISLRQYMPTLLISWSIFIIIFVTTFWLFHMYESLWRYAEAHEFLNCLLANITASALFCTVTWFLLQPPRVPIRMPVSVYVLSAMLAGMGTLIMRMAYRAYRTTSSGRKISSGAKKVMVIGAGQTGNAVIQDINREPKRRYEVVCAVDDSNEKLGRMFQRVKVEGTTSDIPKLVERHGIDLIIFAIPNATSAQRKRITNICAKTKCQLKKVPDLYSYVMDTNSIISQITDVSVEDVLGRDVADIIPKKNAVYLAGKTVMVTGAGGSIGSELCRQIMLQKPKTLVMVDICENGLYDIEQELLRVHGGKCPIRAEVASIRDETKLETLFQEYRPNFIYHAAAHKHVPLMENAPEEAVKNNIFGTLNAVRCADKHGAERFVMISTDKAVNPTNVMGATKRVCEMIVQCMDRVSDTEFVSVRFGNVLGSNGSVIPKFKTQIANGGPVTVTHSEVTRYFMTITEAVSLVLTAGRMAQGGEIFVLDMGEPIRIVDLAEALIRLSGLEPYKDIDITITGLRPGEKLYEELLTEEEGLQKTSNQKIYVGKSTTIPADYLFKSLEQMRPLAEKNQTDMLINRLRDLVPGFGPRKKAVMAVNG